MNYKIILHSVNFSLLRQILWLFIDTQKFTCTTLWSELIKLYDKTKLALPYTFRKASFLSPPSSQRLYAKPITIVTDLKKNQKLILVSITLIGIKQYRFFLFSPTFVRMCGLVTLINRLHRVFAQMQLMCIKLLEIYNI